MTSTTKTILIVVGILVLTGIMTATGFFVGQRWNQGLAYNSQAGIQNRINRISYSRDNEENAVFPGSHFRMSGRGMQRRFSINSSNDEYGSGRGFGMKDSDSVYYPYCGETLILEE